MDSTRSNLDPDQAVDLRTTLSEGPPVPFSMLSDIRSRSENSELVVPTAQYGTVTLRTSNSGQNLEQANLDETTMILPITDEPISTVYPGIKLNPRYLFMNPLNNQNT